jgi:hypothetical protein
MYEPAKKKYWHDEKGSSEHKRGWRWIIELV